MSSHFAQPIFRRAAIMVAVLLALYAAFGFLFVPWLAQRQVPRMLEEKLGRNVSVGDFRANPADG